MPGPGARHWAPPPAAAGQPQDAEPLQRPRWTAGTLLATIAVGAVLYLGQDILVPLALAGLLAFVLDPIVGWLRRLGLPRTPAVAVVVLSTVAVLGATAFFVAGQVTDLAKNLPTYQSTVQGKLRALRKEVAATSGEYGATTRLLATVGGELEAARDALSGSRRPAAPVQVRMTPEPRSAVQALGDMVRPLLGPLGTLGAVLLFLVFVLLDRQQIQDRLLRLTGADLHRSTDALGEAGRRVSRYLTMQLLVNLSYGVPLGLGLWLIGVPGAPLWGLVGALLRFVPYVGPVVAALFPLALSFAVDPGWQMLLWTLALVVTLELVSNNVVEPWLYGASTGLSSLAIVVSAMFWTLLWGPMGLILATPLTVCLAVLGRHVAQLAWLDVLLGSEPAFDAPTRLYQRLLAGDVEEAIELCETQARRDGVLACYSQTTVPALALAAGPMAGAASSAHRHRVSTGMGTLLRNLRADLPAASPAPSAGPPRILCVGARWEVDTLAADMLVHALAHAGLPARLAPASAVSADRIQMLDLHGVDTVCLSVFSSTPEAQVRYIASRLQRRVPSLRVLVGLWNAPPALLDPQAPAQLGVQAVARTLAEMVQRLEALHGASPDAPAGPEPEATPSPQEQRRLQALQALPLADPAVAAALDRAALRAAEVFATPMAMVTLIDADDARWRGSAGLDLHAPGVARCHPRADLPCDLVVTGGQPLFIDDLERDPRLSGAAVRQALGLRSYAGVPLATADGQVIGALCVVDTASRTLDAAERALLQTMADTLMRQLARLAEQAVQADSDARRRAAAQGEVHGGLAAPLGDAAAA